MPTAADVVANGLEGVVVSETAISDVDGERGQLIIAGADVEKLAGSIRYEEAIARVITAAGASIDPAGIGKARASAWSILPRLGDALDHADGMEALRTALSHLRSTGVHPADALTTIGAAPVFVAAWSRQRRKLAPIAPDAARGHAEDYLRMTTGEEPTPAVTAALDAYLVTVIDHAMSASTFTARIVASTGSDLVSAIVAAVGALKGPLHGGAPGPVLDMLDAIGTPDRAEVFLLAELAAGKRIMGMGHRVYRVRDPRAAVLETAVRPLASPRLALARAVETAAAKILRERSRTAPLAANVEFYTSVLLDAVGLPREQFAPTFAVKVASAAGRPHVIEQNRTGRLIRPSSRYIGPRGPRGRRSGHKERIPCIPAMEPAIVGPLHRGTKPPRPSGRSGVRDAPTTNQGR